MNRNLFTRTTVILLYIFIPLFTLGQKKTTLNIATFNIRLNTASDKENAWPNRKEMVKDLVQYHDLDIFGVQEALAVQMADLSEMSQYSHVGVGRDDGKTGGEYSAIFYKNKKYQVIKSGTFWLSPTPEKPSKGWDAAYIRICTWAQFRDKATGKIFFMFNTHFDNEGVQARENAAKMILEKIKLLSNASSPVFITGDFNSDPSTSAYGTIVSAFSDSKLISKAKPYGPEKTFNNFKYHTYTTEVEEGRIDFIFVNKNVQVQKYAVLTDSKELRFPSDHFPVVCEVSF